MNRYKIFHFLLVLLLLSVISCSDDEKNVYETGQKVISLVQPQEENDPLELIVDPAQRSQVKLQAKIDNRSAYGIVVEVEVRGNLVEEFNKKHGTNYQELSANSYSFESNEFIFPKYSETSSSVVININSGGMETHAEYLLPIQMVLVNGDQNATIDPESNTKYIVVSKLAPPELIHLKDVELTTEIGPDKKNWFAAYATNSEGGHTFTVDEAREQSDKMDFALLKFGNNLRLHPSIIGWQHGGDYQRFLYPYIAGFEKLTHLATMNRLFTTDVFDEITTSEEMVEKVAELREIENYNFYVADRMTTHNLQSLGTEKPVLMQGYGPKIAVNSQFSFIHIKEVTSINGGTDYKVRFDIKYIDVDAREEALETDGQTVIIDNPGYNPSNEIVEYKGLELTTEIGPDKKNWFSAYADENQKTFTQVEAREFSSMMDFTMVKHTSNEVRFYDAYVGYHHGGEYETRIAPYIEGFSKLPYTMMGGWRGGTADATKIEHYNDVTDISSLNALIGFYVKTYGYPNTDRMVSDGLAKDRVGVMGWGTKDQANGKFINNAFGIYIIRDFQATTDGHYKAVFDIKIPKHNVRQYNSSTTVNNPSK